MRTTGKPIKIHGRWLIPQRVPKRRWAGYGRKRHVAREQWAEGFRWPWTRNDTNEGRWLGRWGSRLLCFAAGEGSK